MRIKLDDLDQPRITDFLMTWFSMAAGENWAGAFVVASARKVRVMRP